MRLTINDNKKEADLKFDELEATVNAQHDDIKTLVTVSL